MVPAQGDLVPLERIGARQAELGGLHRRLAGHRLSISSARIVPLKLHPAEMSSTTAPASSSVEGRAT